VHGKIPNAPRDFQSPPLKFYLVSFPILFFASLGVQVAYACGLYVMIVWSFFKWQEHSALFCASTFFYLRSLAQLSPTLESLRRLLTFFCSASRIGLLGDPGFPPLPPYQRTMHCDFSTDDGPAPPPGARLLSPSVLE